MPQELNSENEQALPGHVASTVGLGLPAVARLYYTGIGARRYKRASTQSGPGEPLCFVSLAEAALRREKVRTRQADARGDEAMRRAHAAEAREDQVRALLREALDTLTGPQAINCIGMDWYEKTVDVLGPTRQKKVYG